MKYGYFLEKVVERPMAVFYIIANNLFVHPRTRGLEKGRGIKSGYEVGSCKSLKESK